jgi:hypothetical protein
LSSGSEGLIPAVRGRSGPKIGVSAVFGPVTS